MSSPQVKQLLTQLVADVYALTIKTHKFHWNVEGPLFPSLHAMFNTQYDELFDAVDEIAERLRALGVKAPGSLSEFAKLTDIKDSVDAMDDIGMIRELVADNEALSFKSQELFNLATSANDAGTADLAGRRVLVHQKNSWMLRSLFKASTLLSNG